MCCKQECGGYVEVNILQVVDCKLWEVLGYWDKYQENMFIVEVDEDYVCEKVVNVFKLMNCLCYVQVFNQGLKFYCDLLLWMVEFGFCVCYELLGVLYGIMCVCGFI